MSMRTDLGKVRGLGSAKSGTEHFWKQRLTAVSNIPLMIFLVWFIVSHLGLNRADFIASIKNPLITIGLLLAFASFLYHMRIGIQVVIEDYVHGHTTKLVALLANTFFAVILFVTAAYAILKMSFGL